MSVVIVVKENNSALKIRLSDNCTSLSRAQCIFFQIEQEFSTNSADIADKELKNSGNEL